MIRRTVVIFILLVIVYAVLGIAVFDERNFRKAEMVIGIEKVGELNGYSYDVKRYKEYPERCEYRNWVYDIFCKYRIWRLKWLEVMYVPYFKVCMIIWSDGLGPEQKRIQNVRGWSE